MNAPKDKLRRIFRHEITHIFIARGGIVPVAIIGRELFGGMEKAGRELALDAYLDELSKELHREKSDIRGQCIRETRIRVQAAKRGAERNRKYGCEIAKCFFIGLIIREPKTLEEVIALAESQPQNNQIVNGNFNKIQEEVIALAESQQV